MSATKFQILFFSNNFFLKIFNRKDYQLFFLDTGQISSTATI